MNAQARGAEADEKREVVTSCEEVNIRDDKL